MAKINYTTAEKELNDALQALYVKKLMDGQPSVSKRAVAFYGLDQGPRPTPQDSVIAELEAIEKEEKEFERLEAERIQKAKQAIQKDKEAILEGLQAHSELNVEEHPPEATLQTKEPVAQEIPVQEAAPPAISAPESFPTIDDTIPLLPPILLLRRLILWMRQKRVADVYKLIATTEEEVLALREKAPLSPQEEKRVVDILEKGRSVKERLLRKLGLGDDEKIVDQEYKNHKTKRFNKKDTWIPL